MNADHDIELECPRCRQRLFVSADKAGKMIWCPDCDAGIEVPGETRMQSAPSWPSNTWSDFDQARKKPADSAWRRRRASEVSGTVLPPAITMIVVASLGLMLNSFGVLVAVSGPDFLEDPNAPPALQQFVRQSKGPVSAAIQGTCALLSALTILGSVQMLRCKNWGFALSAAILSMVNFGNCCCLLGLPVGIWGVMALARADVRDAFS